MARYLIKDTTKEEREQIVAEALGSMMGSCDGCAARLEDMYQDYIDGKKEIKDINMEYNARYVMNDDRPEKGGCMYS
ncbi:MAG: purine biosynthesis protein PurH [Butyrivibrio sp.]|nr:purine biosynthesis protein PurH [Butyrivibrio sp.]